MGEIEIKQKLQELLQNIVTVEEHHVVYLLVELRKLLEKNAARTRGYPLLKFYADWCVHTQKDRISPEIRVVAEKLFDTAVRAIQARHPQFKKAKTEIEKFAHLDALKDELHKFSFEFGLPTALTADDTAWLNFANSLIKVLEEQPIVAPTNEISSVYFEPSQRGSVIFVIKFAQAIDGHDSYRYANVLY